MFYLVCLFACFFSERIDTILNRTELTDWTSDNSDWVGLQPRGAIAQWAERRTEKPDNTDAGSIPQRVKGLFSQSQLPVQDSLTVSVKPRCVIACISICAHVNPYNYAQRFYLTLNTLMHKAFPFSYKRWPLPKSNRGKYSATSSLNKGSPSSEVHVSRMPKWCSANKTSYAFWIWETVGINGLKWCSASPQEKEENNAA